MRNYVIKGIICYSKTSEEFCIIENGYVVCENGRCAGTYIELPKCYEAFPCYDYENKLVLPGLVDLYIDAPAYSIRGFGMDLETEVRHKVFVLSEEEKYADLSYADKAYDIFVEDLRNSAITRARVLGTVHTDATFLLMKKIEMTGLKAYVETKGSSEDELKVGNFENVRLTEPEMYIGKGIKEGLGREILAGSSLSIFKAMAARHSGIFLGNFEVTKPPLSIENLFYEVTEGAGKYFGKVGSFEREYEFDAVVIDDSAMKYPEKLTVRERLERLIYLAREEHVVAKFVDGKKIFEK